MRTAASSSPTTTSRSTSCLRAERGSAVPLGDPIEDSFVPDGHFDPLREFVDSLDEGTLMLIDVGAREVFDLYRADPSIDPLDDQATSQRVRSYMAPLQRWVVREIGARFDLRTVGTDDSGVEVVELVPIAGSGLIKPAPRVRRYWRLASTYTVPPRRATISASAAMVAIGDRRTAAPIATARVFADWSRPRASDWRRAW